MVHLCFDDFKFPCFMHVTFYVPIICVFVKQRTLFCIKPTVIRLPYCYGLNISHRYSSQITRVHFDSRNYMIFSHIYYIIILIDLLTTTEKWILLSLPGLDFGRLIYFTFTSLTTTKDPLISTLPFTSLPIF